MPARMESHGGFVPRPPNPDVQTAPAALFDVHQVEPAAMPEAICRQVLAAAQRDAVTSPSPTVGEQRLHQSPANPLPADGRIDRELEQSNFRAARRPVQNERDNLPAMPRHHHAAGGDLLTQRLPREKAERVGVAPAEKVDRRQVVERGVGDREAHGGLLGLEKRVPAANGVSGCATRANRRRRTHCRGRKWTKGWIEEGVARRWARGMDAKENSKRRARVVNEKLRLTVQWRSSPPPVPGGREGVASNGAEM